MSDAAPAAPPVRPPSKARLLAPVCLALGFASLAIALTPFGVDHLSTAMRIWLWGLFVAGAASLLSLLGLAVLLIKKPGRAWVGCTLLALLVSSYALAYSLVAGLLEHPRSKQHAECAFDLHVLRLAVAGYAKKHGRYPERLEDVPSFNAILRDWRSPGSKEKFVLWPDGVPATPATEPLPDDVVVAAEPGANQRSHWISVLTPMPAFKSQDPPRQAQQPPPFADSESDPATAGLLEAAGNLALGEQAVRYRLRGQLFGARCTGPLRVTGQGRVAWAAGSGEKEVRVGADTTR